MTLLSDLNNALPSLSKAETRIAQAILANPEAMVSVTTADLARLAQVSDPMISRFCRSLGCASFPEFKVKLAKSLASNISFISESVDPGDDACAYIEKRINANQAALEFIRRKLDPSIIEQAVTRLGESSRIEIFGMGGSAAIAQDAQHKLFRLGIPTMAYNDYLMQRMVAAGADKNTTILMFSFTGRTKEMIEIALIAKESAATIITVTSPHSPLAKLADISISSGDELEDTTIYVPMTTRIVSLTVVDILVTGLALDQGAKLDSHLKKIKHSLDSTKV